MPVPFVPSPNTLQVEMVYGTPGGNAENVYHVHSNAPGQDMAALAAQVITTFHNWETTNMRQFRNTSTGLIHMTVRDLGTQNGLIFEDRTEIDGTRAGIDVPSNVTIAIKWATGRGGRSYRGRTYHIGFTQDMCTHDNLADAVHVPLVTAYNALITGVAGIGGILGLQPNVVQLVVVSKRQNKAWLAQAVTTPITTALLADTNLDSQRRRLIGK